MYWENQNERTRKEAYISRNIEEYKLEMEIRSPMFGY
jgi:hypothetical protein